MTRKRLSQGLAALLLLALTACAAQSLPPGPGPTAPRLMAALPSPAGVPEADEPETAEAPVWEGLFLVSNDGYRLPLRRWLPESEPAIVILALHGLNDYSEAFALPAPRLTDAGVALYAYDQRGFGAGIHPGLWASGERLAQDAATAVTLLRQRHPNKPIFLLGESMGGAVAVVAVADAGAEVDGLILSAPAVWARSTQPWYQRAALWLAVRLFPGWSPGGEGLGRQASDNIEMLRGLGRDPLFLKRTRIDTLEGVVTLMDQALAAAPELRTPTLLLYGEKDEIIPREPVETFWQKLPQDASHTAALYPEGWHLLLRDLQADTVIEDVLAWTESPSPRNGPLPSRADGYAAENFASRTGPAQDAAKDATQEQAGNEGS